MGSADPDEEEEDTARRAHARRPAPSDAEADARRPRVGRAADAAMLWGEMRCAHGWQDLEAAVSVRPVRAAAVGVYVTCHVSLQTHT